MDKPNPFWPWKDMEGQEVHIGDFILYAVRHGDRAGMNKAQVVSKQDDGRLICKVLASSGGKWWVAKKNVTLNVPSRTYLIPEKCSDCPD